LVRAKEQVPFKLSLGMTIWSGDDRVTSTHQPKGTGFISLFQIFPSAKNSIEVVIEGLLQANDNTLLVFPLIFKTNRSSDNVKI